MVVDVFSLLVGVGGCILAGSGWLWIVVVGGGYFGWWWVVVGGGIV